jgi:hypothetical protein
MTDKSPLGFADFWRRLYPQGWRGDRPQSPFLKEFKLKLIQASEVTSLPRGRKATFNEVLTKAIKTIKPGTFGVLEQSEFPAELKITLPILATAKDAKDSRAKVSGLVRKHWANINGDSKVSVLWTPDGFPQVGEKPAS